MPSSGTLKISFTAADYSLCSSVVGFFDDFTVTPMKAEIFQENHYDPFGLNLKGIEATDLQTQQTTPEFRYQYNGKEKTETHRLMWNNHGARNLDLQLGRWWSLDPIAEKYAGFSPFVSMGNNPVKFVDLDGRSIDLYITGEQAKEAFKQLQSSTSLKLRHDDKTGEVTLAEGKQKAKRAADIKLMENIQDEKINVTVDASSKKHTDKGNYFVGGAYVGSFVDENGKVNAKQTVNPTMTSEIDKFYEMPEGTTVLHEILEAYIGAQLNPGLGSPTFDSSTTEYKAFLQAHNAADNLDCNHKTLELTIDEKTGFIYINKIKRINGFDFPFEHLINDRKK